MNDETKIELMKIAAQLTNNVVTSEGKLYSSEKKLILTDINAVFSECLAGVKGQFDKLP